MSATPLNPTTLNPWAPGDVFWLAVTEAYPGGPVPKSAHPVEMTITAIDGAAATVEGHPHLKTVNLESTMILPTLDAAQHQCDRENTPKAILRRLDQLEAEVGGLYAYLLIFRMALDNAAETVMPGPEFLQDRTDFIGQSVLNAAGFVWFELTPQDCMDRIIELVKKLQPLAQDVILNRALHNVDNNPKDIIVPGRN